MSLPATRDLCFPGRLPLPLPPTFRRCRMKVGLEEMYKGSVRKLQASLTSQDEGGGCSERAV